jgi:translation initiation factor 4E
MEDIKIDIKLLNKWVVWYHKQDEPSWDRNTYLKIFTFDSILEYVSFYNSFSCLPQFLNGYYFFMKEGVMPIWEDDNNKRGGCYNIKVSKENTDKVVWDILNHIIINQFLIQNNECINGMSIVPKKYNSLIKVWNNDNKVCLTTIFNSRLAYINQEDVFYRSHEININFGKEFTK